MWNGWSFRTAPLRALRARDAVDRYVAMPGRVRDAVLVDTDPGVKPVLPGSRDIPHGAQDTGQKRARSGLDARVRPVEPPPREDGVPVRIDCNLRLERVLPGDPGRGELLHLGQRAGEERAHSGLDPLHRPVGAPPAEDSVPGVVDCDLGLERVAVLPGEGLNSGQAAIDGGARTRLNPGGGRQLASPDEHRVAAPIDPDLRVGRVRPARRRAWIVPSELAQVI